MRITTKDIKKEDRLRMKSRPKEEGLVQRVFFKFIPFVSGLDLSNNISVPLVRVNIREIEHDTTFEIP